MTRLVVALAALTLGGCYASNVVAPEERAVTVARPQLAWRPATTPLDLEGFWETTEVSGASAGAVLKAYAWFGRDGDYSSAALVVQEGRPRFVVLADDGRWSLSGEALDLHDEGQPLRPLVADGHLRLVGAEATMTFRRVALE